MATGTTTQDLVQFYDGHGPQGPGEAGTEGGYTRLIVTDSRYDALGSGG